MPYGVVWLHDTPESGKRKLVSAPEALEAESAEAARDEGRMILTELSPEQRMVIRPLAVVEIDERIKYGIAGCERVFLANCEDDGELEFVDVSTTEYWSSHGWWAK